MAFSATNHTFSGQNITTVATGGSTGDAVQLTGAGPGTVQQIGTISVYAPGTITAFNIEVTKVDATTIAKHGFSTAYAGPPLRFDPPISCYPNDNAKVVITATGATASNVACTVTYKLAPK